MKVWMIGLSCLLCTQAIADECRIVSSRRDCMSSARDTGSGSHRSRRSAGGLSFGGVSPGDPGLSATRDYGSV